MNSAVFTESGLLSSHSTLVLQIKYVLYPSTSRLSTLTIPRADLQAKLFIELPPPRSNKTILYNLSNAHWKLTLFIQTSLSKQFFQLLSIHPTHSILRKCLMENLHKIFPISSSSSIKEIIDPIYSKLSCQRRAGGNRRKVEARIF